ncbi:MAG: hypothetical protein ABIJ34_03860 [archaeon]
MNVIKTTKSRYSKVKQFRITSPIITRILVVLVLLFLISRFINIKLVLFLILVIFANISMENVRLRANLPADFELSTFSTVLVTMAFGLQWGIFTAIFSKLFTSFATGNVLADHIFMIMTYINAALIASLFSAANVLTLGLIIVVINCILMYLISKNILGLDITSNLSYTLTNLMFNLLVFSIFSQIALRLLI